MRLFEVDRVGPGIGFCGLGEGARMLRAGDRIGVSIS